MDLEQRTDALTKVATLLGDGPADLAWSVEQAHLYLRIEAGVKKWAICADAEPREAAEIMCVDYLLRKLANAAGVCHKCQAPVRRAPNDPVTHKAPRRMYRCPACLYSWRDS